MCKETQLSETNIIRWGETSLWVRTPSYYSLYITDIYNNFSLHKYSKSKTFSSLGEIQPINWQLKKRIFLFRISINKSSNPWLALGPSTPFILCFSFATQALCETETRSHRDQVSASSLFLLHLVLSCPYQILVQQFHKDFNFSYFLLKFSSPSIEISCPPHPSPAHLL